MKLDYTIEQGAGSSNVFSARINKSQTTNKIYGQSAKFFARVIKRRLKPGRGYTLADLGSFDGSLLENTLKLLPKYKFQTFGVDRKENLKNNHSAHKRTVADLSKIPLDSKSMDVVLARYVMIWNDKQKQKKVLGEISRITRGFAIIQSAGSDIKNQKLWHKKFNYLLSGKDVPKLHRIGYYFSSRDEVEKWMKELDINFSRIQNRKVDKFSNVFCEKYNLNKKDCLRVKEILKGMDFTIQNTWIVYPNKLK